MRTRLPVVITLALALLGPAIANASNGQERTWNFNQVTVPGAQELGRLGAGATVAVVDTWVDFTHPDLDDRVIGHAVCVGMNGRCRDRSYSRDECEHGTHVAGTVASTRYGVAPRASVLAVQVLAYDRDGGGCGGTAQDVAAGIRFATSKNVDVINLSLGTLVPGVFTSEQVAAAVHDAARAGVVVIFAAGNSTAPISDNYGSDALLVAATGPNGRIATYSTRGGSVSVGAPGGDDGAAGLTSCRPENCIRSTLPDGSYGLLEGTSMAAPHVSGVAALLLAQDPKRGRNDVMTTLQSTARPLDGTRHGLLDATAALRRRASGPSQPPPTSSAVPGDSSQTQRPEPPRIQAHRPTTAPGTGGSRDESTHGSATPDTGEFALPPPATNDGAPPRQGSPPAEDDGLPVSAMVAFGGLAALGIIGALWSAFGSAPRGRRGDLDDV